MLLTLSTTHQPATDLGFLLRKNPARAHRFSLSFGEAHVVYPEAEQTRCTAALIVRVDPVALVRGRRGPSGEGGLLSQYVNDRPYAASSFLSVAIAEVFGSALSGHAKERPDLVGLPMPLEARLPVLPCRAGETFLRGLFEPLGYTVQARQLPLDSDFAGWGFSPYFDVTLRAETTVQRFLTHLYVLIPVLDDDKHYWVGANEVEKLLRRGEGWLENHPFREIITRRYLRHQRTLIDDALARLLEGEGETPHHGGDLSAEDESGKTPNLNDQRLAAVLAVLKNSGARRVLDLGCGEGRLLRLLEAEPQFTEITGADVSSRALEIASRRLKLDRLPETRRGRIRLLQTSLTYRDSRLNGYDAAAVVEVIEHLDPGRLDAFEQALFGCARPRVVVLTTPNREYNTLWQSLPAGDLRHDDHRFEWSRAEFQSWAERVAAAFRYRVRFLPVGPEDPAAGPPTQMAVFERAADTPTA